MATSPAAPRVAIQPETEKTSATAQAPRGPRSPPPPRVFFRWAVFQKVQGTTARTATRVSHFLPFGRAAKRGSQLSRQARRPFASGTEQEKVSFRADLPGRQRDLNRGARRAVVGTMSTMDRMPCTGRALNSAGTRLECADNGSTAR